MELLYLWIKKFKNIEEQGFNFSPKHHFEFTPLKNDEVIISGKLEKKDFEFPDNFFAQGSGENYIQNITAVIGANGCGKSSLMEFIVNYTLGSDIETYLPNAEIYRIGGEFKSIWVLKNDGGKFIVFTNLPDINLTTNFDDNIEWSHTFDTFPFVGEKYSRELNYQRCHFVKEVLGILPVYYTNIFREEIIIAEKENRDDYVFYSEGKTNHYIKDCYDISINHLMRNKAYDNTTIMLFYLQEMQRIVFFIQDFWHWFEKGNNLNIQLPKYLHLNGFRQPSFEDELQKRFNIGELIIQDLQSTEYIFLYPKAKICLFFWQQWIRHYYELFKEQEETVKNILKDVCLIKYEQNNFHKNSYEIENAFFDFVRRVKKETRLIKKYELLPDSHDLLTIGQKFIQESFINRLNSINETYDIIEKQIEIDGVIRDLKSIESIIPFPYTFSFSFDEKITQPTMSSGEKNFLVLFGRLYEIKKEIESNEKKIESILLLLDEAELTLHPDWQTHFVEYIIEGINKIFDGYKIQIILTSHSPFVVSDLPKSNIIFLQKDENGMSKVSQSDISNTFGANIHTLLKKSFFLENGLMGSFAKKKIETLIKNLNNSSERTSEMQQQIQLIGEPFLREQIQKLYDDGNSVSARISKLERELSELRSQVESKNAE